ncbi:MAG: hypothetical protein FWH05_08120 [Oscillospiraceae bacterium]|nr:hypothetical protein [Oscillospiraceae bacterium]
MSKSKKLRILSGIMATVFLMSSLLFGSVSADDTIGLGDYIEIGDVVDKGNDDIISEELDEETDETNEETGENSEKTDENSEETDENSEENSEILNQEVQEENLELQSTGNFAPGGDKRLPDSTYEPYMPNAHVVEINFNSLVGAPGGGAVGEADQFGNVSFADGVFNWICPGPGELSYHMRYNNLPFNSNVSAGGAGGPTDAGLTEPTPDMVGSLEGIEIRGAFDIRGNPIVTDTRDGRYFTINVPAGATGSRLSVWAHGSDAGRVVNVRRGTDPINGQIVGAGQYIPAGFYPGWVSDEGVTQTGSAENRPLKMDFDLPGPGVYTYSLASANNSRTFLMRLEYTFEPRPTLTDAAANIRINPNIELVGKELRVNWSGNIGWEGVDKVALIVIDTNSGLAVESPTDPVVIQRTWEARVGENKTLAYPIPRSGNYRFILLGSRETGRGAGMIDAGIVDIDNYNDGFAIESPPYPAMGQPGYAANVQLEDPIILTTYRDKFKPDDYIIKWRAVPEGSRYELQIRQPAAGTNWNNARMLYSGPKSDYVLNLAEPIDIGGQPLTIGNEYDFRVRAFRNEGPGFNPALDQVDGTRVRARIDFEDRTWLYGVMGKGFEASTLGPANYATYGFTYLYDDVNKPVLAEGVGSMGEGLTNTSPNKRGFTYHRDHQYYGTTSLFFPMQTNYRNIPITVDPTKSATEGGFPAKLYMSSPILTKFREGHTGFSFFYTEIDPERQNWSLEATFKIADRVEDTFRGRSEPTDTQSGFGLIATDLATQNDFLAYINSIAVGMGRIRFISPTGEELQVEGSPGLIVKTGWFDKTGETSPDGIYVWGTDTMCFDQFYRATLRNDPLIPGYDMRWIAHDRFAIKEMGNEGETFVFKLEKDNFGFRGTFLSARIMDGSRQSWQYTDPLGQNYGGTPFVDNPLVAYGELVKVDANGEYVFDENGQFILDPDGKYVPDYHVRIQDPDRYFVGMFVSRKMAAEITDIKWQEFDPDSQPKPAPGTNPRPTRYQSIALRVDSTATTGSPTFSPAFVTNVTGTIEITDTNYRRIAGPYEIEGNKRTLVPLNLEQGVNDLFATVKIDRSKRQNLETGFEIDPTQDEFELRFSITVRSIADPAYAIYVSPGGTVIAAGTRSDPMSLREALNYSRPGQQIVMLGGRYPINTRLVIQRGNDGGTLMADPGAHVVLDYTNSTNGGIYLRGDNWHIHGFDIDSGSSRNNPGHAGRPIQISGHGNRIERMNVLNATDTGIQISGYATETIDTGWPNNNLVISSTSKNCADIQRANSDGMAAKQIVGRGNMFKYCISSFNADDGWDMFAESTYGPIGPVIIDSCVSYANGMPDYDYDEVSGVPGSFVAAKLGNGNGFKMGGANMAVPHEIRNCISMFNYAIGFDANTGTGLKVYNSTAFRNVMGITMTSVFRIQDLPPEQQDLLKFRAYNNLLFESGGRIRISTDKMHPLIGNEFFLQGNDGTVSNGGPVVRNPDGSIAYGTFDSNLGGPDSDFYIPTMTYLEDAERNWFDIFNSQNPSNPFKKPTIAPDGTIEMNGFLLPTEQTPMSEPIPQLQVPPGFNPAEIQPWTSEGKVKGADFRNLKPDPGANIILKPDRVDGGGGGEGGGGPTFDGRRGGGGGGAAPGTVTTGTGGAAGNTISTRAAISAVESAVSAAVAQAQAAGNDTSSINVNVRFANVAVVTGETFAAMAAASNESGGRITLTIDSLTADKSRVDVRVIVDVTKANETLNLSGTTTGAVPRQIKERFDKFFSNVALVIQLGQNGSYGQEATVAARAPGITNGERLNFYSYDRATNKFRPLRVSQYRVDKNGYLHFTTSEGGTIVVTKGAIKKVDGS